MKKKRKNNKIYNNHKIINEVINEVIKEVEVIVEVIIKVIIEVIIEVIKEVIHIEDEEKRNNYIKNNTTKNLKNKFKIIFKN